MLHVIPVRDDTVGHWILQVEDAALALSFVTTDETSDRFEIGSKDTLDQIGSKDTLDQIGSNLVQNV